MKLKSKELDSIYFTNDKSCQDAFVWLIASTMVTRDSKTPMVIFY